MWDSLGRLGAWATRSKKRGRALGRRTAHHEHVSVPRRTHPSPLLVDDEEDEDNDKDGTTSHGSCDVEPVLEDRKQQVRVVDDAEGEDPELGHAGWMAAGTDFMFFF